MSFSSDIKEKLCSVPYECSRCGIYEISGALLFGGSFDKKGIRFATEHGEVAKRVRDGIYSCFGIKADILQVSKMSRIEISDTYQTENIGGGISLEGDIPFSCCRASFLRGAFLGGGSVTDPKKGYHMEFNTRYEKCAKALQKILAADDFSAKITSRKGYYVIYIKGGEEIADILGFMGAPQGAFEMFNLQAEREMRNDINRRVNCENANTNKAAKASSKHLFAISKIRKAKKWDKLPDVLKEIGQLREEYPEDSLKELGEKTNPPIGKSGVNHRLSRILEIAENL